MDHLSMTDESSANICSPVEPSEHNTTTNTVQSSNQTEGKYKSTEEPDADKSKTSKQSDADKNETSEQADPDLSLSNMNHNLTVVIFGNSAAVQYGDDNILLGKKLHPENAKIPMIDPVQVNISGRHVSVINMIGLHETEHQRDSMDHLIGQLLNENEIHSYIFVVRLGQLTDADKMGVEWLQGVFGDRATDFAMILFTYEQQEESESIIDDLKKNTVLEELYDKCGSRYYTCNKIMNNLSEMTKLIDGIQHLCFDNKQQGYTRELYNTELKKRKIQQNIECQKNHLTTTDEGCFGIVHTKTREIHEEMAEKCSTEGAGLNQNKKCEIKEKTERLFQRLHLDNTQECKLRAADVLQLTAHSLQSHECCTEEELVQTFIQKLLMMNYRARNITIKENDMQHDRQQQENDSTDKGDVDIFEELIFCTESISKSGSIHPMDVQMAVFHRADSFLKQLMVTKLSQCQYALPLLVPDPLTKEIQFPLWTFRQINKCLKMKNANNEIVRKIQPVYKIKTPMVFFFRFDTLPSSKSQLINSLINEKHNTFFHRNCPGSSKTRLLMEGVVEIAWYCPSGKDTDKFTDCVAFCNLHGDAGDNEKQLDILTEMASVNVIILPRLDRSVKGATKINNLSRKPLICLFAEDESTVSKTKTGIYRIGLKDRNQSDVSEELRQAIIDCLSLSRSTFKLEDVSKHVDRVDEDEDENCKKGKAAAKKIMKLLESENLTKVKESLLPFQGTLWHSWCEKIKELQQGNVTGRDITRKKANLMQIREQQHALDISEFVHLFIKEITSKPLDEKVFFLKWLPILLDEYTTAELSELHHKYDKKWSEVLKRKDNRAEQLTSPVNDEDTELDKIANELQAATFGLEHILREIGQIYESCSSLVKEKEGLQCGYSSLPSLAAEMMISGFPLELMDGDAAHVPLIWITAVLDELIKKLGDQQVFVLSVLGVQSSGKSTMLNAMFGLQFAVSAGRCTRGAFMQLVKVSKEMKEKLKFDYILVVDTEGLRAPELAGRSTKHHDNVMATFVVGLGNLTLINIFGENPSEMQDILQIVVQAFLRMKQVKLNPSCMFVHQNVSDDTAGEKNMEGRRRLQETLDKMTKLAAKEEVCDAEYFSDVINFDIQKDVKYFAQLWEGSPPMAPPNPSYCENIKELKAFLNDALTSNGIRLTCIKDRIKDLWEALLNERFVFSFKNSLEIAAYRKLETEYSKWSWSLRSTMLEIENKLHNRIENEAINEVVETELQGQLKEKSEEVNQSMSEFFENDKDRDISIQWQALFEIKIKELGENIVRETKRKLNDILQQRDLKRKIDAHKLHHENTLFEKSKELAMKLKDKANNEAILKQEFDAFWKECLKKITTNTPSIKDIDILGDMKTIHTDIYKSTPVESWKEDRENKDIFFVQSYSKYVKLRKSSGWTGQVRNAYNATKERFGCTLSIEDETHIRRLINDIAHQTEKMIMSYNIPKMGYNKSYIQELADYIKARVMDYEEGCLTYMFTNEFYMDLLQSIFKRKNNTFTEHLKMFRESNDPVFYFERKREEYYSIFQKYCQGATSAAIFGEIICQKLKEPIEKSVYKNTARDLANEMKTNCESLNGNRSKLEKHILKTLAEEMNFDKYIEYIFNPREHFNCFIRAEVNKYITAKFYTSVLPKIKENIELLQQNIMSAAHKATGINGDIDEWLKHFTQELSDVLVFSIKDLSGVSHDGVDDFNILEDVIRKELPSVILDIISNCSTDTFPAKLENKDRSYQILIDHLGQCCWVQCPFCAAICTNSIENHDGDHSVPFHRVDGLSGCCYDFTDGLSADFCTNLVITTKTFYTGQWIPCKEYRSAGGVYAKWSITPDMSELPYWKWFVCEFKQQLEDYFGKKFHKWDEISYGWEHYDSQQAIESLDKYI